MLLPVVCWALAMGKQVFDTRGSVGPSTWYAHLSQDLRPDPGSLGQELCVCPSRVSLLSALRGPDSGTENWPG